jgi:tetratricopeptide (TPR) repeat protein
MPELPTGGDGVEEWEVLDLLTSLVQKSLVVYEEDEQGQGRYRLLETVRQYSRDRLLESGEAERVRGQHQEWCLRYTEQVEWELRQSDPGAYFDRLELEHDNLRAALEWSNQEGSVVEAGLQLAHALAPFWEVRGHWQEGGEWLIQLLARAGSSLGPAQRARALLTAGRLAFAQWQYESAVSLYKESRAIFCELGDKSGIAQTVEAEALVPWNQGGYERAAALGQESLSLYRELGDQRGILRALGFLAVVAEQQGDWGRTTALVEEGRPLAQELGELGYGRHVLAIVAMRQGEYERANQLFEEDLIRPRRTGNRVHMGWNLAFLAHIALRQGDVERAVQLGEESLALLRAVGRKTGVAEALGLLGTVARRQGNHPRARALLVERVAVLRELGEQGGIAEWKVKTGIAECFEELGEAARMRDQLERGALLFGAAAALREGANAPAYAAIWAEIEQGTAAVRTALGEEAFAAAWAEGRAMGLEEAVRYALEEGENG